MRDTAIQSALAADMLGTRMMNNERIMHIWRGCYRRWDAARCRGISTMAGRWICVQKGAFRNEIFHSFKWQLYAQNMRMNTKNNIMKIT